MHAPKRRRRSCASNRPSPPCRGSRPRPSPALNKAIFESGLHALRRAAARRARRPRRAWAPTDTFRFANRLHAWIEVDDGTHRRLRLRRRQRDGRHDGAARQEGPRALRRPSRFPSCAPSPRSATTSVRFVQTFGGRPALPAPRRVNHPPFMQFEGPTVWTTLALTLHADGRSEWELVGASPFPRHWVYDNEGKLTAKAGLTDFKEWWRHSFGKHTPWGDEDSPALVTTVETALERELSTAIMRGGEKPKVRKLKEGQVLVEQGQLGTRAVPPARRRDRGRRRRRVARRPRTRRDRRRAGAHRGRPAHGDAAGASPRRGSRSPTTTRSIRDALARAERGSPARGDR